MIENRASQTALSVAWLRAAHQVLDIPLILEDAAILALLGPSAREQIESRVEELQNPITFALRSHVALRSRFAEDRLHKAVGRGVRQYVLLGAGYDTFCLRQPDWAAPLRITEADQSATQRDKLARIKQAGMMVPPNVTFLCVDFETETLSDAIQRSGIDQLAPTFFSCLGVTVYLTDDAVTALFSTVAGFPPGSEIAFTFSQPRDGEDAKTRAAGAILAEQVAAVGEPWRSHFTVVEIRDRLAAAGFQQIDFLAPDDARKQYFADRTDSLPPPRRISICSAIR